MLRGHNRYEYVNSVAEYHQVANPIINPIKGVNFRDPYTTACEPRKATNLGPLFHGLHPIVPDNGWHNTIAAFRKRCNYYSAARATPFVIHSAHEFVKAVCPKKLLGFNWNEEMFRDYVAKFDPVKRQRLQEALWTLPKTNLGDYTSKTIFVKIEALLVGHKPNWAPRIIYKGSAIYNAIAGPMFNELMKRFDRCLSGMHGDYQFRTSYAKQPEEYLKHVERQSTSDYWAEADFSSNDKFQCADVQLLEVAMMRVLGAPEWFIRLHLKTDTFRVTNGKQGISATLKHQLPTGASDTTFRNTFWNGCILWAVCMKLKLRKCRAILMGDDMLACMNGESHYMAKVYASVASEARMEAKVFRRNNMFEATFLSKMLIPSAYGFHMALPLFGKALGRFNARANNNQSVSDEAYMLGKSIGYAYEFRFYPVLRDLFIERSKLEAVFVTQQLQETDSITWNARTAGVTLTNITSKINQHAREGLVLSDDDLTAFCYERYELTGLEVVDMFRQVVLSRNMTQDVVGIVVEKLKQDFA